MVERVLIFDFDGVLADSLDVFEACVHIACLAQTSAIFVVTSGIAGVVAGVLRRHGVTCVRQILGAEEGTGKAQKIRMAAATCPGKPFFYIGDTCGDMLEGREAGAHTVAAAWGWHDVARLRTAQPEHLLLAPSELVALFGKAKGQDA